RSTLFPYTTLFRSHMQFLAPLGRSAPSISIPAYDAEGDPRSRWGHSYFCAVIRQGECSAPELTSRTWKHFLPAPERGAKAPLYPTLACCYALPMSHPGSDGSPFKDGFAAVWHEPALLAAELTWRWCFGFSAWALVIISGGLFLDSIKISRADEFLLGTFQPQLLSGVFQRIFRGSLTRFVLEQSVLLLGVTLSWCFERRRKATAVEM